MKYGFIRDQAGAYPVTRLCRLLFVQHSAFYAWQAQLVKVIAADELALRRRMKNLPDEGLRLAESGGAG